MVNTKDQIIKVLQEITEANKINLEFPENEAFGDYSTNIAMLMVADPNRHLYQEKLRDGKISISEFKNPRKFAEFLVGQLQKDKEIVKTIEKIEVAGPGFINFWLKKDVLIDNLMLIDREKEKYGSAKTGRGKTIIIDYSSPNIAKRFGIGHLRSTVIGQALYNLYEFLGYKVIGDNHLGDWGTQFGTLLYQVSSKHLEVKDLNIDKLEKLYVEFNKEAETKEELWDEARAWFKKLEDGDKVARRLWQEMVDISMAEFNKVYELLGIKIDYAYGESFYEDYMPQVIKLLREKGLSRVSEGAEIVEFKGLPPAMLIKKDGATTYYTRDLATILFRVGSWKPELFIYEVGSEQALHFKQVFATAKLLGWARGRSFVHVGHGLIRFEHGKMSTRRGDTIKLEDVLSEAIIRARKIIDGSETGRGLSESEKKEVAKEVGVGSIKYFDLSHQPQTDIIFDWEKLFQLEGNSAAYLQYTFARIHSLLAKAPHIQHTTYNIQNDEEMKVLRSLVHFSEVVADAAQKYSPNLLCNYLFDLAQKYNFFYNEHRIIGGANEAFELLLSGACAQVLKNSLKILGIQTPERM